MFDLGLAGKVALIVGGSDGLGRAAALEAVDDDDWRKDIDLNLGACGCADWRGSFYRRRPRLWGHDRLPA